VSAGTVEVDGMPACVLGHRLATPAAGDPEGVFVEWEWNGERLLVRNDRYGCYPAYYFASPDEIAVSPSIPVLLGLGGPAELDEMALAVLLRYGFFLGEDTPFKHIRALPAHARLEWRPGRMHLTHEIRPVTPQPLTRVQALDGYTALFREAVRKRLAPPGRTVVLPLSGGRDSRHILFALCAAGRAPDVCVTYRHFPQYPNDADVAAARQVADAVGVLHEVLAQPLPFFQALAQKNLLTSFCAPDEHEQYLALAAYLEPRDAVTYHGLAGDNLTGSHLKGHYLALYEAGRFTQLAYRLLEEHAHARETVLRHILPPAQYRRFSLDAALAHVADELRKHGGAANPIGSFYFWNKTRRETALSAFAMLPGSTVHTPYLDHALVDFARSLPASLLLDHTFHEEAIGKAYPQYAGIPFAPAGHYAVVPHRTVKPFARALAACLLRTPSTLVNKQHVAPRLLARAIDGDFPRMLWIVPDLLLYLLQLESLQHQRARMSWWQ
jgi:asparagine synthetase B (glutamine-hydrolysing)